MATSLYDQYYSEINTKSMLNLVNKILYDKTNKKIHTIDDYNIYMNNFNSIFNSTKQVDIVELNKELVEKQLTVFLDKFFNESNTASEPINKIKEPFDNLEPKKEDSNTRDNMKTKLSMFLNNSKDNTNNIDNNNNIIDNNNNDNNDNNINLNINDDNLKLSTLNVNTNINKIDEKINTILDSSIDKKQNALLSSNRNIDSSRFNYTIENDKQITYIDSIILPIENTTHFTSPIIKLSIKELQYETNLILQNTFQLNNYNYGLYKPNKSNVTINSDKLTIQFSSLYDDSDYENDIYQCTISNNIISSDELDINDFKINDIIKIMENDTIEYSKIIEIRDNTIIIDGIEKEYKKPYILNMNLENSILFT